MNKIKLMITIDLHLFDNSKTDLRLGIFKYENKVSSYREDFVLGFVPLETFSPKSLFKYKCVLLKIHLYSGQTEAFLLKF